MGQITATRNLVATKVVRLAGQSGLFSTSPGLNWMAAMYWLLYGENKLIRGPFIWDIIISNIIVLNSIKLQWLRIDNRFI